MTKSSWLNLYVTHFQWNIWLKNSVTVSESNQYLINRSLKALSTKSAVFYSAFTSFGCLVNLDLMCPFRPQKQPWLTQSLSSCYIFNSFAHIIFKNHFLTIHPVWSAPVCMNAVDVYFSKRFDEKTVPFSLAEGHNGSPSGLWTFNLFLAQKVNR